MIIVYHKDYKIVEVNHADKLDNSLLYAKTIVKGIMLISEHYKDEVLVWCEISNKNHLNIPHIKSLFQQPNELYAYTPSENYLGNKIGYIDESIFINVHKKVKYPTWQMSSEVGALHLSILNNNKEQLSADTNFDYFLNSFAKLGISKGLCCYSEPKLLKGGHQNQIKSQKASTFKLYKFVKQHYKFQWLFLLFFNELIYEHTLSVIPLIKALFYKSRQKVVLDFEAIVDNKSIKRTNEITIDVIIPTIGRKPYLYDVLCDLRIQTHLPKNVIIVEQNPLEKSVSELEYLTNENWPFSIKHTFTHQAGACNARNLALSQVESELIFFADDDIRFDNKFISMAMNNMSSIGVEVASFACIQQHEKVPFTNYFQWNSFGSGCSIAKSTSIEQCKFEVGYEFGFGEDADFGMQLRKLGVDIYYLPSPYLIHLKAPIGGFRTKPILLWSDEIIQPKPSPTVMLFTLKHKTNEQLKGYKTILFFKYYQVQKIKNPFRYFFSLQQQWNKSIFWANELRKTNDYEI